MFAAIAVIFSTHFVNMFLFTSVSVKEVWTNQIKFVPKLSTTVKNSETVYRTKKCQPSGFLFTPDSVDGNNTTGWLSVAQFSEDNTI